MSAICRALSQRGLWLLLSAGLISLAGDWVLRVGLAYYVYVLTGSTLASALMLLASFIPQILLSSLAGVYLDRWQHSRTMIVALLLAAGLVPLVAVHRAGQVWIVYTVLAFEGCVQQFFAPAQQSLLPSLIEDDHLVTANALNGQTSDLARLIGSAVGGVVAGAGGITALALADIASFLISALLIARISAARREATPPPGMQSLGQRLRRLRAEWADGLRMSTRHRVLRVIMIFLLVVSVGEGVMSTLFAPFVRSALHGSSDDYGLIVSVHAVGGIAGGLVAASIGDRVRASRLLGWGALAFGLIDLVMFLDPLAWVAVWPAAACMIVVGLPGALTIAGAMTLVQRHSGDSHRGRVFGAPGVVEGIAVVAGTVAAGFLGQAIGIIRSWQLRAAVMSRPDCSCSSPCGRVLTVSDWLHRVRYSVIVSCRKSRWPPASPQPLPCPPDCQDRITAIDVVQHDPAWSPQFQAEAAALTDVLGPWLAGRLEHSSTSVGRAECETHPGHDGGPPRSDLHQRRDSPPDQSWLHPLSARASDAGFSASCDPAPTRQYQELKDRLAADSPDLVVCTAGKRAFVVRVVGGSRDNGRTVAFCS